MINVKFFSTCDSQISGCLADELSTDLSKALQRAGILRTVGDEALLDDVNLFLHHIHRLEEVIVKLLPYLLNLRLQVLFCFGLAEFEELGLEFLAGSRDALTKHSLIVRHVLPERLLLEHGDTLLSDLLVCLLQNRLVKRLFCREKRPLHLPIVALD